MPIIPKEDIERIKRDVCVVSLIKSSGVTLKKAGRNLTGHCPFHDDTTPSLVVTPSKNLWHCMGACQTGGSNVDWIMKRDGVSFFRAATIVQKMNGNGGQGAVVRVQGTGKVEEKIKTQETEGRRQEPEEQQKLLNQVIDHYHETLLSTKSPEALAFLKKRGIHNTDAIKTFKLGYADRTVGEHLAKNPSLPQPSIIRQQLKEIGIVRKSGHEHFNGCLVIPVIDEKGNVQEVYGRKIIHSPKPNILNHLYLSGPHKGVWNITALVESKEIILCESLIDALTFWCAGLHNVTTAYGTGGLTKDHIKAFTHYGIKKVLIAYDRDEAGEKAAAKTAEKLYPLGIDCRRILFPKGLDANEYACIAKPASKSLPLLIDAALQRPAILKGAGDRVQGAEKEKSTAKEKNKKLLPTVPDTHDIPVTISGDDINLTIGDRLYRVRGLSKNLSADSMKINIRLFVTDRYHIDTLDLYNARHRTVFINSAAKEVQRETDSIKRDIGKILLTLEQIQHEQIKKALEPEKKEVLMTPKEKEEALEFLKSPDLTERIIADFEKCGMVGEQTNTLFGYLAAISRKLDDPLAVIVQSSSGAGKSTLMDAVFDFIPPEDKIKYTAMTGQSLFYMDKDALVHKTLAISEDEGAQRARYAIKTMQSEKNLSIACTGKDPKTGRQTTERYEVNGPVQIFSNSTDMELDEELQNRFNILTSNETREQTQAIHRMQRKMETLEGLKMKQARHYIITLHQNAQRLIKPLDVVNPYADKLTFLDTRLRTRRDHKKYLILIRSIALLHQHQREIKKREYKGGVSEYIEVTIQDIEVANRLANDVLGISLDELAPQTRRLLTLTTEMVQNVCEKQKVEQEDYRFTRKTIRYHTGWGNTQLKIHLHRLEELEYLLVHKGCRGQSFVYELLYKGEGKDGEPFLLGLIEMKQLTPHGKSSSTKRVESILKKSGVKHNKSGLSRSQVGVKSVPNRGTKNSGNPYRVMI